MSESTTKQTPSEDDKLDDSLEDTFPASDPPSQTDPTHGVKHAPEPEQP